jgi:hypothetical protein
MVVSLRERERNEIKNRKGKKTFLKDKIREEGDDEPKMKKMKLMRSSIHRRHIIQGRSPTFLQF